MPLVTFYDSSKTDEHQLTAVLSHADAKLQFVYEPISGSNVDANTEVLSVFVTSNVTDELMAKMPKLKLIACRSTGYNNIDIEAAGRRNVIVANVPTYGENTVAEYAFTLLLAIKRQLIPTIETLPSGTPTSESLIGSDLAGQVIGIVGTGHIGKHVAKIANGFGMKVVAYDPFPNQATAQELGFMYLPFDQLVTLCDVLTLHVPYLPETHHLINAEVLSKLKPDCVLINTARGEIIDTKALVEALEQHKLAGAGLDVLEGEKLLNIHEEMLLLRQKTIPSDLLKLSVELDLLKKMPGVIVTPHVAYNTSQAIDRINQTTGRNIIAFLDGQPVNVLKKTATKPGKLLLARHGESEWNAQGKWTGIRDVHLTEKGFHEAALLGQAITAINVDYAYTSEQIRALETLEGMLDAAQKFDVPFERSSALNERDYGDYTGKNKWEMRDLIGQEAFNHLRRDWDYAVPGGETLKMVYERAVPFLLKEIVPKVAAGNNVLVVSHGNAIRALVKYIEQISNEGISGVEMPFGNILVYDLDREGHSCHKEELKIETTPPPA